MLGQPQPKQKKTLANHLLNYTLPPRQQQPLWQQPVQGKRSSAVPYIKERFVNANFRFIMNERYQQSMDADRFVDWRQVEVVLAPLSRCPICLTDEPVIPRISRCGHVFCFSCILHFLALSDVGNCAICNDGLSLYELKSVLPQVYSDSERKKFKLMQRHCHSLTALPKVAFSKWAVNSLPKLMTAIPDPNIINYSKTMIGSPQYLLGVVNVELSACLALLKEAQDEEIIYLDMALQSLKNREKAIISASPILSAQDSNDMLLSRSLPKLNVIKLSPSSPKYMDSLALPQSYQQEGTKLIKKTDSSEELETSSSDAQISPMLKPTQVDGMFYYYMCADGQFVFLHPLDIKIMKGYYQEYSAMPDDIGIVPSFVSETTLTEDVRKRCKYLSHLPLGCDIAFVEVNWIDQTVLPQEYIKKWKTDLKYRAKKHVQKETKAKQVVQKPIVPLTRPKTPEMVFDFDDVASWVSLSAEPQNEKVIISLQQGSYAQKTKGKSYSDLFPTTLNEEKPPPTVNSVWVQRKVPDQASVTVQSVPSKKKKEKIVLFTTGVKRSN